VEKKSPQKHSKNLEILEPFIRWLKKRLGSTHNEHGHASAATTSNTEEQQTPSQQDQDRLNRSTTCLDASRKPSTGKINSKMNQAVSQS
jgi:hypothetical protein